jgi:hypothetical protein
MREPKPHYPISWLLDLIGNRELEGQSPSKPPWWGARGGREPSWVPSTSTPLKGHSWSLRPPNPTTFIPYKVY